jgi:hypothetical protein
VAEYKVLKPFTYLRGDGAVVRQTKIGSLVELDDNGAQQAGAAVEAVNKPQLVGPQSEPEQTPTDEPEKPHRRRSHRHADVAEPAQAGSEEGAQPVTGPDGR